MLNPELSREDATTRWFYDPWRERPRVAWAALVAAILLCMLILASRESFVVSVALCLLCIGAFAPALSAVECRWDDQGPARRGWLGWERRRWSDIRRIEVLPAGALLSPYPRRHVLDSARGLVLPMPGAQRDDLLSDLRETWKRHEH